MPVSISSVAHMVSAPGTVDLSSYIMLKEYSVECQRGGVSIKPPYLRAAMRQGVRKAFTKRIQTNKLLKMEIRANTRPILTKAG